MIIPVVLCITGCPVGVAPPLGKPGSEKIDKELIGIWSQPNPDLEVIKMEISKIDEYSLKVTILERGESFMEENDIFKAWMTIIDGKKFLYLQEDGNAIGNYYTYCFDIKGKTLKTYDVTLKVGGVDAVTSTEAYRKEISASLQFEDALVGESVWSRN